MYKIALISDIHFGCRNNGEKYLNICENFFLHTLSKVIEDNKITDLRILGDLFDNRNSINVRTLNTVLNIFKTYENRFPQLRIKCLVGNHDLYYHNRVDINSLEAIRQFKNVEVITEVVKEVINDKSIIMVPWITSNTSEIYEKFNYYCNSKERVDYLLGHFEIHNFEVIPGMKFEGGIKASQFSNFNRVISGHFHSRNMEGNIGYLGCPYELTWSDYGDGKGIHLLDIDTNEITFIQNNDSPKHTKIKLSDIIKYNKDTEKIKDIFSKCRNNIVKLVIDTKFKDSTIVKILNKIESLQPIKLEVDNQCIDQITFDENAESNIKDLNDPLSFLIEYCNNIQIDELDKEEQQDMFNKLKELYQISLKDND
jgi:DNA repair exonuclease SbcCD nuclease subunit